MGDTVSSRPPERSAITDARTRSPPVDSMAGSMATSEPPVVRMSSTRKTRSPGAMVNPRRNSRRVRAVRVPDLLREDAPHAQLAGDLEGEDDAAGGRPHDDVHDRAPVAVPDHVGHEAAQLDDRLGVLEHLELLQVAVAVAAALEQEVAVP